MVLGYSLTATNSWSHALVHCCLLLMHLRLWMGKLRRAFFCLGAEINQCPIKRNGSVSCLMKALPPGCRGHRLCGEDQISLALITPSFPGIVYPHLFSNPWLLGSFCGVLGALLRRLSWIFGNNRHVGGSEASSNKINCWHAPRTASHDFVFIYLKKKHTAQLCTV